MKEIRSLIVEIDGNGKGHITAKCPFVKESLTCLHGILFTLGIIIVLVEHCLKD